MTTLQFSLFLAGLLVCYLLVHLRLLKFESHLAQLEQLDTMRRAMLHVAKQLDSLAATRLAQEEKAEDPPASAPSTALQGAVEELGKSMSALSRQMSTMNDRLDQDAVDRPVAQPVLVPGPEGTPAERLRMAVETRLLSLGYGRLRILTDLDDGDPLDRERELSVECERGGMDYKGRVVTRNGSVLDVQLQSVAQAFP